MSLDHHSNKWDRKEAQAMKRSNQQFEEARPARIAVGERAFRFLVDNFALDTALAAAVSVEYRLAAEWEAEQEEMRARRDPYTVFEISVEGMAQAQKAFDNLPPGQDARAEQYVLNLLAQFPVDQAWLTAHRVREEIEGWRKRKTWSEAA